MTGGPDREAPADPAVIGRVVRPHGLGGEIVVEPEGSSMAFGPLDGTLWLDGAWRSVTRCRFDNKGRWVIGLEGIVDRDGAEELRGAELLLEADELPELERDNYYIHDLVGCRIEDVAGNALGDVVAVVSGPQDLLEIDHNGERSLVPMARDLLRKIDIEGRRIVIDAPRGLTEATRS